MSSELNSGAATPIAAGLITDLDRLAGLALDVLVHHRHVIAARVGRHAREHFIHDHAQAVDVRALVDFLAQDLFRRHVLGRADHVAGFRQLSVALVLGGGGTSSPSNTLFFNPPQCRVITAVGAPDPATGKRPPIYVKEHAPWSAVRNATHSYGFAAFSVEPGSLRGDITTIKVTYYDVVGSDGQLAPFETFTLRRPRRD